MSFLQRLNDAMERRIVRNRERNTVREAEVVLLRERRKQLREDLKRIKKNR